MSTENLFGRTKEKVAKRKPAILRVGNMLLVFIVSYLTSCTIGFLSLKYVGILLSRPKLNLLASLKEIDSYIVLLLALMPVVTFLIIGYMRNQLLLNHRLAFLSDRIGIGLRVFIGPTMCFYLAALVVHYSNNGKELDFELVELCYFLISLSSSAFGIWATQLADYQKIDARLKDMLRSSFFKDEISDDNIEKIFSDFSEEIFKVNSGGRGDAAENYRILHDLYGDSIFLYSPTFFYRLSRYYINCMLFKEKNPNTVGVIRFLGQRWNERGIDLDYSLGANDPENKDKRKAMLSLAPNGFLLKIEVEEEKRTSI